MIDNSELLNIIDNRIRKLQQETIGTKLYTGVVTIPINDNWCKARVSGFETEFTFANKSGEFLNQGDSVYIETVNGDLNSGVVIRRFDTYTPNERMSGKKGYHTPQKCIFPVGFIIMMAIADNPTDYFGGSWTPVAQGRCLIGTGTYGEGASEKGEFATYTLNEEGGELKKKLSAVVGATDGRAERIGYVAEGATKNQPTPTYSVVGASYTTGGSFTHSTPVVEPDIDDRYVNMMQPYLAVNIWKRIA